MGEASWSMLGARGSLCAFAAVMICSPASASSIYMVPTSAVVLAVASFPATSQCLYMTYDKNGNRLNRSSSVISAAPASWGASAYGCSRWGPSS